MKKKTTSEYVEPNGYGTVTRQSARVGGRVCRARGADFQVGGLTRTRKREPTRGFRGHAPPGKFEVLFF